MISKGQINISRRIKNSSGFVDNIQAHFKWKRMMQASSREEFNKKQRHISKLRLKRQLPNFEMVSYDDGQNIEWDRWAHTDGWVSCINPGNFEPPQPHYTEWEEKTWPRWNTRPKARKSPWHLNPRKPRLKLKPKLNQSELDKLWIISESSNMIPKCQRPRTCKHYTQVEFKQANSNRKKRTNVKKMKKKIFLPD